MNEINNVGAAYPLQYSDASFQTGMNLRDYFAAKALQALIGHDGKDGENRGKKAVPILAAFAYEYADAMLAAREAK